jgi:PAS domain S-box-containing protein/putative nucleotidyltransferase with HDIG domain
MADGKLKTRTDKKTKKIKCWELLKCNKTECPAYESKDLRCWLFSGTYCRDEIQGKTLEKMEICLGCDVFKANIDIPAMNVTCQVLNKQVSEFRLIVDERDREMENICMYLSIGLSEVFEALKKIASGDPSVRILESSEIELISKLKHLVNLTAEDIGGIVDQSHEFAIGLAEHFDVLHKVTRGDLNARVSGSSGVELMESLKDITNQMVESISREINERKEAEESIRKLEALESALLSAIPHAIVGLQNYKIIFANDAVASVFGWEPEELIGKSTRILYRNDNEYEEIGKNFYPVLQKQRTHSEEFPCRHKDGRDIVCKVSASVIGNELKDLGIVVMYEDITEKKAFENKLLRTTEEWRTTFDSMPYGVMLLDVNCNIMRTNNYIVRLLGTPFANIIGQKCYHVIHDLERNIEGCPLLKSRETCQTETLESYDARLNKYFLSNVTPILNDEGLIKAYVHSLIDITEMKDKEKMLTESRNAFSNMLKDLDVSYQELKGLYEGLIHSFVNAMDAKSPWTKGHSERVTSYATAIAKAMGLNDNEIETLRIASLLHDIGKIGTYDVILDKPGRLTNEEFSLVKTHPVKGEEILKPIKQLQNILSIVRSHHERLDGNGYPDKLKGMEIPFMARIITVADSFDSMTSDRPYRPSPGKDYAISELKKYRGIQFDIQVVDAFLQVLEGME